jgi:glyoxylase-like metal-dependent hydrolase (beta-lactamase superfamily II)
MREAATSPPVITTLTAATAIAEAALTPDAPRWEVVAVRYGTRTTTRAACYHEYESLGEPNAPLGMDYFFWLLRGEAGTILVDCGFGTQAGARRGRTMLCEPVEALRRLDVQPATIDLLVISHMHYDLLVQRRELAFWTDPKLPDEHTGHVEEDEVARVAAAVEDGRAKVPDGGGVIAPGVGAILVGGHSPGQIALIVKGREQPVLLASDAVHYYEELGGALRFAVFTDLEETVAGYGVLAALAKRTGAVLVPGHDPLVTERFPPVGKDLTGLAVRLG